MEKQKYLIMTTYGKVYAENEEGESYWTFQEDKAKPLLFNTAQEKVSDLEKDGIMCHVEQFL